MLNYMDKALSTGKLVRVPVEADQIAAKVIGALDGDISGLSSRLAVIFDEHPFTQKPGIFDQAARLAASQRDEGYSRRQDALYLRVVATALEAQCRQYGPFPNEVDQLIQKIIMVLIPETEAQHP